MRKIRGWEIECWLGTNKGGCVLLRIIIAFPEWHLVWSFWLVNLMEGDGERGVQWNWNLSFHLVHKKGMSFSVITSSISHVLYYAIAICN